MNTNDISFLQKQALTVMQALIGVVSPNFRMVSVSLTEGKVDILVVLEAEDANDREEIADFYDELACLQPNDLEFEVRTEINSKEIVLSKPSADNVVVYRRRE